MTGGHDPVAQCQVFELERLKKWIVGHEVILFEVARLPDISISYFHAQLTHLSSYLKIRHE